MADEEEDDEELEIGAPRMKQARQPGRSALPDTRAGPEDRSAPWWMWDMADMTRHARTGRHQEKGRALDVGVRLGKVATSAHGPM